MEPLTVDLPPFMVVIDYRFIVFEKLSIYKKLLNIEERCFVS